MEMWRLWMMLGVYLLYIAGHSGSTIIGCEQGTLDVQEGTSYSFTSDIYQYNIYDNNGRTLCNCNNYYYFYYYYPLCELVIYFGVSEYSYSCYKNSYTTAITRDSVRMIFWDYNGPRAHCSFKITATPVYENDSCDVSISNWTVTGSCNITGMYSSDNKYTCTWREQNNPKEEFGGWDELESYQATNTRLYTRGVCSFTRPILFLSGLYTYIMTVSPGSNTYYNNTIFIDSPDQVQLNHNCPSYALEGSSVICICNASTTGSPPGLLAWYEMTNETLLLTNVSKDTNGKQFTCRLEWGSNGVIKAMISYILNVAYGPTDVIINRIAEKAEEKSGIIRFTCLAIYFYPSVMFQWNITCVNQTDYTHFSLCSINITERVDDVKIECTATNTYFPQVFFSRVYDLPIEDSPDQVQLNHSCPSYALEGSSVICTCNASTTGSPPGLLAWYEMTNETLLLTNVSKDTNGKQFTCRLEWGSSRAIKAMISYILNVAYGPSDVIIHRIAEAAEEKSRIIRFTCTAIYFYPSVMFQWNITCENQTDYTHFSLCSINITERVDDVVIECTAINTYFPQVFFSRVYDLQFEEREPESSKDSSSECVNTNIVGGVGAAAIVLLIIAAVLVVCIIKLQNGIGKKKEKPLSHLRAIFKRRKSQNLADHKSVSLRDIYSIAGSITADDGVDNEEIYETIEIRMTPENGECTTAMKIMPATGGNHNCKDLSDTSYAKVARYNKEEDVYENVAN